MSPGWWILPMALLGSIVWLVGLWFLVRWLILL